MIFNHPDTPNGIRTNLATTTTSYLT